MNITELIADKKDILKALRFHKKFIDIDTIFYI